MNLFHFKKRLTKDFKHFRASWIRLTNRFRPALLQLTHTCNLYCEYCDCWKKEKAQGEMGTDFIATEELKDQLYLHYKNGYREIYFCGGEPLLHPGWAEIARYGKQINLNQVLFTNGVHYPVVAAEARKLFTKVYCLINHPEEDGNNAISGFSHYQYVKSAVTAARDVAQHFVLNFMVSIESVTVLPDMEELARELNVPWRITPIGSYYGEKGFNTETIRYIKRFKYNPSVELNTFEIALLPTVSACRGVVYNQILYKILFANAQSKMLNVYLALIMGKTVTGK